MDKRDDLRTIKTQLKIDTQFKRLMHLVGYDQLSIVMLMNHAKCSRVAFYSHYKNLDDLYLKHVLEFVHHFSFLLDQKTIFSHPHLISVETKQLVTNQLAQSLEKVEQEKDFIVAMIEAGNHQKFSDSIHKLVFEIHPEKSQSINSENELFILPVDLVVSFVTNILVSTIYWWLTKPNTIDNNVLANTLFELITNLPFEPKN